ncbi:hypothetical protein [Ferruginibacter profundus]
MEEKLAAGKLQNIIRNKQLILFKLPQAATKNINLPMLFYLPYTPVW